MSNKRRPKTFDERYEELVGDFKKMELAIKQFEITKEDHWVQTVADILFKFLVKRGRQKPLFFELANIKNFPLVVYVSGIAITSLKSEKEGRIPKPKASFTFSFLSPLPTEFNTFPTKLDEALDMRYIVLGGREFTLREIIINIRDTEGSHSDRDRPEALDKLGRAEWLGYSSAYMSVYDLGKVMMVLGKNFMNHVKG